MIDHIGMSVTDVAKSKAFYRSALAPLGYAVIMEFANAFRADNRKQVDAFYKAAVAAGGRDNGSPGLRPQYHANYYGAFVLDPDGNNIEAVCHTSE